MLRSTINNDLLRRLYLYWDERRTNRFFPSRSDIDPIEFSFALGKIALVDVFYDPLKFRYRVWGIEYALSSGVEMTGKFLTEHPDAGYRQIWTDRFTEIVNRRVPSYRGAEGLKLAQSPNAEMVLLPLGDADHQVDMIMIATHHPDEVPQLGRLSA